MACYLKGNASSVCAKAYFYTIMVCYTHYLSTHVEVLARLRQDLPHCKSINICLFYIYLDIIIVGFWIADYWWHVVLTALLQASYHFMAPTCGTYTHKYLSA